MAAVIAFGHQEEAGSSLSDSLTRIADEIAGLPAENSDFDHLLDDASEIPSSPRHHSFLSLSHKYTVESRLTEVKLFLYYVNKCLLGFNQ